MTRTTLHPIALALVVGLAACAGPVAATANFASTLDDTDSTAPDYALESTEVTQGDSAEIRVTLPENGNATVQIGSQEVNYLLDATVEDGNGDGVVVVEFNTVASPDHQAVTTADSADHVSVRSETELWSQEWPPWRASVPLDPGEYPLTLLTDDEEAYDGETGVTGADTGTLEIHEKACSYSSDDRNAYSIPETEAYYGETVSIPVSMPVNGTATLRVAGPSGSFGLAATVRDGDADGRVVVTMDTRGTVERPLSVAGDADSLTMLTNDTDGAALEPSEPFEYAIGVWHGENASSVCREMADRRLAVRPVSAYDVEAPTAVERGTVASVSVSVPENGSSVLRVADDDFELAVEVTDGDGDGRVVAALDTATMRTESPSVTAESASDDVSLRELSTKSDGAAMHAGEYQLALQVDRDDSRYQVVSDSLVVRGDDGAVETTTSATETTANEPSGVPGFGVSPALVGVVVGLVAAVAGRRR